MKKVIYFIALLFSPVYLLAQTEEISIKKCIQNYIDGTSYNKPDHIEKAFYPEANLFLSHKDKDLWIVPASEYTKWFKKGDQGQFNGRIGRIISIELNNNIALAKAEILIPDKKLEFMDMFLLKKIQGEWKIISKSASSINTNKSGRNILFIVSNAHYYGKSILATGNSFSEIVNAYHTFKTAGYTVDFVSPKGGSIPLAYINTSDTLQKQYLFDPDFMYAMKNTKKPEEIDSKNYKAVHYIGGGAAMYDVPENKEIQTIALKVYEENKGIISSVCHGTAGIVNLKTNDGNYLVSGKKISGYPDSFEKQDGDYFKHFPFLIQKTIEERGGVFKFSPRNASHVETDGRIVTGQNFQSSSGVALKIIELINGAKNE
ncbi:Putative intracellular protease/amidase [Pedobacter steynii]|uniref:Putative intracellular protease/amidase n=1 Tax=Pedobacter steynii TaxID=430522 RepID=A0A1G9JNL3_9SPHI|nr:nuclear transport factor 2 family protein [Pedobacter steynii]NQX38301.1 nuclear transport factor 2 family protein [Pedobacter steynii]SDL38795.1 Putative intracellular protease/amidase [Pedobacter steynii]